MATKVAFSGRPSRAHARGTGPKSGGGPAPSPTGLPHNQGLARSPGGRGGPGGRWKGAVGGVV